MLVKQVQVPRASDPWATASLREHALAAGAGQIEGMRDQGRREVWRQL